MTAHAPGSAGRPAAPETAPADATRPLLGLRAVAVPPGVARPPEPRTAPPASGRAFRPDIEGLRAVAVIAVVLFHAGLPGVDGGFVGVDVFFVVSGFLITGLLWREAAAAGRIRLARFFGGRARRLLPAGIAVLVTTAAAATWLLPPLQVEQALGDAVAGIFYATNVRLAVRGTDYLAADEPSSPFQHFWSLGVEEQFYLFWPLLILGVGWVAWRGSRGATGERSPVPLVIALAVLTAVSLAVSLELARTSPPWAYFSLPSRAWELGAGGLLALGLPLWRRVPAALAGAAGWLGLALVVAAVVTLDESVPFPGTAALLPVVGTVLVLAAGSAPGPRWGVAGLLSVAPLRFLGRTSYSWYLWHWPVLVLAPLAVGSAFGLGARLTAAAVALLLAVATLYAVENPLRLASSLKRSAGRSLALGGALTAAGVAAVLVLGIVAPSSVGSGAAAEAATLAAPEVEPAPADPTTPVVDPLDQRVTDLSAQLQGAVAGSAGLQAVPSNLIPALSEARADVPAAFTNGCVLTWTASERSTCTYGDPAAPVSIALVGDSHAAQWQPALAPAAEQHGWRLQLSSKVTCPLLDLPIISPYLDRAYGECVAWREQVVADLVANPPSVILLAMTRRYGGDFGFVSYDAAWLDALSRMVADLEATGARVVVLGPVPDPHAVVPTCLSLNLNSVGACTPDRATGVNTGGVAAEAQVVTAAGGRYVDFTDLFCTPVECPLIVGNRLVYRDDNHLTASYAEFLAPVLGAVVDRELAR